MNDLLRNKEQLRERLEQAERELMDPKVLSDARAMKRFGRERNQATELLAAMAEYESALATVSEREGLLHDSADADLVTLARDEIDGARKRAEETESRLRMLLIPKDPNDGKSAIIEIRAGTGG